MHWYIYPLNKNIFGDEQFSLPVDQKSNKVFQKTNVIILATFGISGRLLRKKSKSYSSDSTESEGLVEVSDTEDYNSDKINFEYIVFRNLSYPSQNQNTEG